MNPLVHSESSMKKFKGRTEKDFDKFLDIHTKMDCSKAYVSDNRHRLLTHTMFWVKEVMIPLFGIYITLDDGKKVSVKDICEQHILEDYKFKFIPTPQDFIEHLPIKKWMENGTGIELPSSARQLYPELEEERIKQHLKEQAEEAEKTWLKSFPQLLESDIFPTLPNPTYPSRKHWETQIMD